MLVFYGIKLVAYSKDRYDTYNLRKQLITFHFFKQYKSSAVAEMGDRLVTIHMGRKRGAAVPLSEAELDSHLPHYGLGRGITPY